MWAGEHFTGCIQARKRCFTPGLTNCAESIKTPIPVSYTHLDVYKRQVVKAYSSAVGAGEFVSEIFGAEADELRRRGGDGGEFGATTGRPRRMGWFDAVASRYGCRMQGATEVCLLYTSRCV